MRLLSVSLQSLEINVTSQGQTEAIRINILGKPKLEQQSNKDHIGIINDLDLLDCILGANVQGPHIFGSQHANSMLTLYVVLSQTT